MAATVFLTLAFAALCRAAESVSGAANAESGAAKRKSPGPAGRLKKFPPHRPERRRRPPFCARR